MTRFFSLGISTGAAFLLGACGAPALYRPYADSGSYGYSEVNIAKNRYDVYFHGPSDMEDAEAKRFAIIRAAEIGRENGFAYFRIAGSKVRRESSRDFRSEPELFPENPWTGESLTREEREQRAWEDSRRRRQRMAAAAKDAPIVQLSVQYRNEDCDDCLSVATKVREAAERGFLKP